MATRDELVTMAIEQADGNDEATGGRWSPTEVLYALDLTFRREWDNILASAPDERVNTVITATDAAGLLPFSSLTTGTGDARKVFHNLIQLSDGVNIYRQTRMDLVAPDNAGFDAYTFYKSGDGFQLLPDTSVLSVRAVVNWRPVAPLDLVDGSSTVDFPAEGLLLLAYCTAALLLSKGGTEVSQGADLLKVARQVREDMLSAMKRRTPMPAFPRYPDRSAHWASR